MLSGAEPQSPRRCRPGPACRRPARQRPRSRWLRTQRRRLRRSTRSAATGSSTVASITSVAPRVVATSSLPATRSIAISCRAPAMRAPCSAARPMPPSPITATTSPGRTGAVLSAAPRPVEAPHPSRHAWARSSPSGTQNTCGARTTVWVASDPIDSVPVSTAPSAACRRGGCSHQWSQRRGRPRRHAVRPRTGPPRRGALHRRHHVGDALADLLDDAGALMAEQHRERRSPVAVCDRPQVGVTHAVGDDRTSTSPSPGASTWMGSIWRRTPARRRPRPVLRSCARSSSFPGMVHGRHACYRPADGRPSLRDLPQVGVCRDRSFPDRTVDIVAVDLAERVGTPTLTAISRKVVTKAARWSATIRSHRRSKRRYAAPAHPGMSPRLSRRCGG